MRHADELAHQIKHTSQQQSEDYGPFVYGHISSYDPVTHRVRCILPSMRDEGGNAILTGWMPLGTSMAGASIGFQYAPLGGATVQNPTAGELVKISRFDRTLGVGHIDGFMFNQVSAPPFTGMQPGELGIKANGSFFYLHHNGDIELNAQGKVLINTTGDTDITTHGALNVTTTGNCSLNSSGNLSLIATGSLLIEATSSAVQAIGGTAQKLLNAMAAIVYNGHTHVANGDPPTQQMDSTDMTSILEAQ